MEQDTSSVYDAKRALHVTTQYYVSIKLGRAVYVESVSSRAYIRE